MSSDTPMSELPSETEVGINFTGLARGLQGDIHVYEKGRLRMATMDMQAAKNKLRKIEDRGHNSSHM